MTAFSVPLWRKRLADVQRRLGVPVTPSDMFKGGLDRMEAEAAAKEWAEKMADRVDISDGNAIRDYMGKMGPSVLGAQIFRDPPHFATKPVSLKEMVKMRMRWTEVPFPFFECHQPTGSDKVFVFFVKDDQAVILEDEAGLFPSDSLITKLRLL